jgi:hypothetical protein
MLIFSLIEYCGAEVLILSYFLIPLCFFLRFPFHFFFIFPYFMVWGNLGYIFGCDYISYGLTL